jgi:hypothetical protein
MKNTCLIFTVFAILFMISTGCSNQKVNMPTQPGMDSITDGLPVSGEVNENTSLWGTWTLDVNTENLSSEVNISRECSTHINVTSFIPPPEIVITSYNPSTQTLEADVTITNPYPINVYDVRLIVYTNNSGFLLVNADDWTNLFDIAGGLPINPFMAYAKSVPGRVFSNYPPQTEHVIIHFPDPPGPINIAITASYPGNCDEPYSLDLFYCEPLLSSPGSSAWSEVTAYDWQSNVNYVAMYAPAITGVTLLDMGFVSGNKWGVNIVNETGAPEGKYDAFLLAGSSNSGSLYLYDKVTIEISSGGLPLNPMDVTPKSLNFCPMDVFIDGKFAYVAGSYNGLHVFNIADPSQPKWVSNVDLPWRVHSVFVQNGHAYVGGLGIRIIDVTNPEMPYVEKVIDLGGWLCEDVVVLNGFAYVAQLTEGMRILDVDPISSAGLVSTVVTSGKAYGVDVSPDGLFAYVADENYALHIIKINDPYAASIIKSVTLPGKGWAVEYENGYAYVSDGDLQIVDVEPPMDAYIEKSVTVSNYTKKLVYNNGYIYTSANQSGIQVIDVYPVGSAYVAGSADTQGYAYGIDISGGYAYVASEAGGLYVYDLTSPYIPDIVANLPTPGNVQDVTIDKGYAYIANNNGGFQVVDIQIPESSHMVRTLETLSFFTGVDTDAGFAYGANSTRGLEIIDISDPSNAYYVNNIDAGYMENVVVQDGYAYALDNDVGLLIIDVDPFDSAYIVNTVPLPQFFCGITYADGYAYVAGHSYGLYIIDVDPVMSASIVQTVDTDGYAWDAAIQEDLAFVADCTQGVKVVDISDPLTASIIKEIDIPQNSYGIDVQGDFAYVANYEYGLYILSINPISTASIFSELEFKRGGLRVDVEGKYAYVAGFEGGLTIVQLY